MTERAKQENKQLEELTIGEHKKLCLARDEGVIIQDPEWIHPGPHLKSGYTNDAEAFTKLLKREAPEEANAYLLTISSRNSFSGSYIVTYFRVNESLFFPSGFML